MLTRLEVNGFKNLVDFSVDFGPFTCVTGPAGVGKSNVFDVIRFLSLLTDHTIAEAASHVRGWEFYGEPAAGLFFSDGSHRVDRLEIAAEMLVRGNTRDDFGRQAEASSSFLRYELAFRYAAPSSDGAATAGLVLEREELRPIIEARAARHLKFPHSKTRFRDNAVYNSRHARTGFMSTHYDPDTNEPMVAVHQDGGYAARGAPSPAYRATRTTIGLENTSATPTILAAKHEMQGWRVFDLDPAAMRQPDRLGQPPGIADNGAHLPATLHRRVSAAREQGLDAASVLDPLIASVSAVAPVSTIHVDRDEAAQTLALIWEEPSGLKIGSSAVSGSALRLLAFETLAQSPEPPALLCVENPDSGLAWDSVEILNAILHRMAVDTNLDTGPGNLLRQVIVASQSLPLLQLQDLQDLLLAKPSGTVAGPQQPRQNILRCHPHTGSWRCAGLDEGVDLSYLWPESTAQTRLQMGFPAQFWEQA